MNMCRSHWMSIQQPQKHARRSISRQRIRRRLQNIKVVFAIRIRSELPTQVVISLVFWVLEIVFSVRGRLPDIDDGVGDSLAGEQVGDLTVHERGVAVGCGVLNDGAAELTEGCVG